MLGNARVLWLHCCKVFFLVTFICLKLLLYIVVLGANKALKARLTWSEKQCLRWTPWQATVGAGLPVISTLQSLLKTGDTVQQIEGIFSGTLSYIFNTFGTHTSFSEVVAQAKAAGFTEPDPREDLSGGRPSTYQSSFRDTGCYEPGTANSMPQCHNAWSSHQGLPILDLRACRVVSQCLGCEGPTILRKTSKVFFACGQAWM